MKLTHSTCPRCGAPLKLVEHQRFVMCAFCNATMRPDAQASATASPALQQVQQIPEEVVARIKRLVLDGERDAAIDLCASTAGLPRDEACATVDQMLLPAVGEFMRDLPLNGFGVLMRLALIGGGPALVAYGIRRVLDGDWTGVAFAIPGVLLAVVAARSLMSRAITATFVSS